MKIHAEMCGQKVTIESDVEVITIDDIVENAIKPLLLALGFHPTNVSEALDINVWCEQCNDNNDTVHASVVSSAGGGTSVTTLDKESNISYT